MSCPFNGNINRCSRLRVKAGVIVLNSVQSRDIKGESVSLFLKWNQVFIEPQHEAVFHVYISVGYQRSIFLIVI